MKLKAFALAAAILLLSIPHHASADAMGRSRNPKGVYGVGGGGSNIYGIRQKLNPRAFSGRSGSRRLFAPIRGNDNAAYGVRRNYQNLAGFVGKNYFSSGSKRFF